MRYSRRTFLQAVTAAIAMRGTLARGQDVVTTPAATAPYIPPIVLDAHQDALKRVLDAGNDLGDTYPGEQGSIPKWKAGKVNVIWFSVWVDPRKFAGDAATERALRLIATYRHQCSLYPGILAHCDTAAQVREAVAGGKIATMLVIEGGAVINNKIELLAKFRAEGVRYMTLTWRGNLDWAGSSQSNDPSKGLSPMGRDIIEEMNKLGILVDLSHVSDRTFYESLETTKKPAIVSHSNARLLSPHPRNVSDSMLKALAQNDGVIGVNFAGDFLRPNAEGTGYERAPGRPGIKSVVDQCDHIRKVAGIRHLGLGTDYDGGIRPAEGLEHAAKMPAFWEALAAAGYSNGDMDKVGAENFLRVLAANE